MGMKEIMCWLGEMNMEHEKIQFEDDCTQVVQVINNEHTNRYELESIIELCRNIWLLITTKMSVMLGDK
jgi:hypothetical protein